MLDKSILKNRIFLNFRIAWEERKKPLQFHYISMIISPHFECMGDILSSSSQNRYYNVSFMHFTIHYKCILSLLYNQMEMNSTQKKLAHIFRSQFTYLEWLQWSSRWVLAYLLVIAVTCYNWEDLCYINLLGKTRSFKISKKLVYFLAI